MELIEDYRVRSNSSQGNDIRAQQTNKGQERGTKIKQTNKKKKKNTNQSVKQIPRFCYYLSIIFLNSLLADDTVKRLIEISIIFHTFQENDITLLFNSSIVNKTDELSSFSRSSSHNHLYRFYYLYKLHL